mgnify:CR=1 FL=1
MSIFLQEATRELLHRYYKDFESDPDIFMDMEQFHPYQYDVERVDAYCEAKVFRSDRKVFMIMDDTAPVGELLLKNIDLEKGQCELSIHLQRDEVKNRGFGTQAEILALRYAFEVFKLNTVYAGSVQKNARSQHVLEKVGFVLMKEDDIFKYYKIEEMNFRKSSVTRFRRV